MIDKLNKITKNLGNNLIKWRNTNGVEGHWKGTQFKAKADVWAHDFLVANLNKLTKNIPIISEEDPNSLKKNRPDIYWLIDPIDGTASYINGYNGFVTQVALIENNQIKLASVYTPALNELYYAEKGKGAYLNNNKIKLNNQNQINSLIDNYPSPKGIAKKVLEYFHIKNYIECGSIGLKICKVASGDSNLFIKDVIIRDWDLAPAHLIIKEAGGELCCIDGSSFTYEGNYEHYGLIAASSNEIKNQVINWYKEISKSE